MLTQRSAWAGPLGPQAWMRRWPVAPPPLTRPLVWTPPSPRPRRPRHGLASSAVTRRMVWTRLRRPLRPRHWLVLPRAATGLAEQHLRRPRRQCAQRLVVEHQCGCGPSTDTSSTFRKASTGLDQQQLRTARRQLPQQLVLRPRQFGRGLGLLRSRSERRERHAADPNGQDGGDVFGDGGAGTPTTSSDDPTGPP